MHSLLQSILPTGITIVLWCVTMYLATLDCAIANPSLSSSPWMRGAPQRGFLTQRAVIRSRESGVR